MVPVKQEPSFQGGWKLAKKSLLQVFKKMVPYKFYMDVILEQTSSCLVDEHLPHLTEGEFQQYIGVWLLVSTCSGWSQYDFWSTKEYNRKTNACPYNFKDKMSKKRFDEITRELQFTNLSPPSY